MSYQHAVARAGVDRHVKETVSQIPLGEVRVRLDHMSYIEHSGKAERHRVGLEVRALRVVLARSPFVALVHDCPRMHRGARSEEHRRLARRHILERAEEDVAVGLDAAHALGRRVLPLVLVDLVKAEGLVASDAMALGHELLDER